MKKIKIFLAVVLSLSLFGCATKQTQEPSYKEENVTISSKRDTKIHATLTLPSEENKDGYPLVLLAHGFMGSRDESGSFTEVSQNLAKEGIASIRIDFPGCNESEEAFTDYTIDNMLDDVSTSLEYVKKQTTINEDKIGLLGYSMGGRIASLSLETMDVNTLVLWAPAASDGLSAGIFMGDEAFLTQKIEESKESGKATLELWGEEVVVSHEYLVQMRDTNPTKALHAYKGNALIVTGGVDDLILSSVTDKVIEACANTNITANLEVPRIGHGLGSYDEDLEARKIVVDSTVNFYVDNMK
ncbi:alpha/beta hydrolase family protein [Amedibacillus sp. YH-ame6]